MEIAMLVLTAIGVVAAIIAALPPLGFDLRIIGRPRMPLEGIPHFRARQAWIAIAIAAISLGVSVTAFYYFFRPRVVDKIVEKPVDRIVEKVVEKDCPKSALVGKPKQSPPPPTASTFGDKSPAVGSVTQGPCSNLQIGGSANQQGGNCTSPNRRVKAADIPALIELLRQHRGIVRFAVGAGDVESVQFAQDWYDIFQKAQWDLNPKRIVQFMNMTGSLPTGIRITVKGERLSSQMQIKVEPDSPLSSVVKALNAEGVTPTFWQEPSYEDGVILISVDAQPVDKQTN